MQANVRATSTASFGRSLAVSARCHDAEAESAARHSRRQQQQQQQRQTAGAVLGEPQCRAPGHASLRPHPARGARRKTMSAMAWSRRALCSASCYTTGHLAVSHALPGVECGVDRAAVANYSPRAWAVVRCGHAAWLYPRQQHGAADAAALRLRAPGRGASCAVPLRAQPCTKGNRLGPLGEGATRGSCDLSSCFRATVKGRRRPGRTNELATRPGLRRGQIKGQAMQQLLHHITPRNPLVHG